MAQFITRETNQSLSSESIVFFGTGDVSLASLKHLANIYRIEAIITKPDSINHGRTNYPAVKKWAIANSIDVHQPENKHNLTEHFESARYISRVAVVIDYGIIISDDVIDYFPLGIINSHFSLLPELRGADPITFSLLSGQKETGVSLMKINPQLDEGDIIVRGSLEISKDDTNQTLTSKLIDKSNELLSTSLPQYMAGQIKPQPQKSDGISYSKKIAKADGELDFDESVARLEREIRAYQPWPGSYTTIDGTVVLVTSAEIAQQPNDLQAGTLVLLSKNQLGVVCDDGILEIKSLKPQGKNIMNSQAFLAGRQDFKASLAMLQG
ncbi:methionyl-tRNA formyltransferase [Candidatus Saccharibacteria bacterium]|nr:methionyl-tRNA formyltransferase [Candidatus Saccharibacteria bacterium]